MDSALKFTLAEKKITAAPACRDEPTKGCGELRSVEEILFQQEEFISNDWARQTLFVRKLDEGLRLRFRTFQHNNLCYVFDPSHLVKGVERSSLGGVMTSYQRKKIIADCRSICTLTGPKVSNLISLFEKWGILSSVIGAVIEGRHFHYLKNPGHFQHCLGLADAIDLSMTTSGVTVRFPGLIRRRVDEKTPWRARKHAKGSKPFHYTMKRLTSKHRLFHLLLHYLRSIPIRDKEREYVSLIKNTLASNFSKQTGQELPNGDTFPLFPDHVQLKLDRLFLHRKKERVQFYFNLLQSKALCAPVGKDMIDEAYMKHRKSLCRSREDLHVVPEHHLNGLREYGRLVGKRVNELYCPYETTLPNGRACVEKGRHLGGNLSQLRENKNVQLYSNHPVSHLDPNHVRFEPYVIGLFGPPGSGKTTITQCLVRNLGRKLFPGLSREQLSYSRSCSTKHWDGYSGQPIVVLDDFGQDLSSREDIVEFENLISVNDYVLPMAELSEKGQKFVSPIVILTSNMKYGSDLRSNNTSHVEEPWAVWRRITLPLLMDSGKVFEYQLEPSRNQQDIWKRKYSSVKPEFGPLACSWSGLASSDRDEGKVTIEPVPGDIHDLVTRMVKEIDERFNYHQHHFQDIWKQVISQKRIDCSPSNHELLRWDVHVEDVSLPCTNRDWTLEMQFPSFPPSDSPKVKAIALSEPLKVRMITAAESQTKVLQPFQQALWRYLSEQPQFCLTNGVKAPWSEHESFENDTLPWIYRIETMIKEIRDRSDENDLWLSGDYTAATDNFPMSVTEALIEGILSEIEHQPTKDWVRWECSSHEILYPDGIVDRQTSGQLMGSLLSFPLLCFLNDYIVSYSGFEKFSYLINGDDVVARGSGETINKWRAQAPQVGLSLSLGKNFIDPEFCTVNSQLFFNGDVLHTGKVSCQKRVGVPLAYCFEETQFYWGNDDWVLYEFLKRNLIALRSTPRSLLLSKKLGGLGLMNSLGSGIKYDLKLMKRVYLYDLIRPYMTSFRVPGTSISAIPVPVLRGETAKSEVLPGTRTMNHLRNFLLQSQEGDGPDMTHRDLSKFEKIVAEKFPRQTADHIGSIVNHGAYHIKDFPDKDFLETEYLFVQNGKAAFVLDRARQHCLDLFEKKLRQREVHPCEYEGGDLHDLPGLKGPWEELKEIFIDRNLLLEGCGEQYDLGITEDLAAWFDELSSSEVQLEGTGTFVPVPTDYRPSIIEHSPFGDESSTQAVNNLRGEI